MSGLWRIEVLGGLRAIHRDRVVTRFRTQKTGLLLAYLALAGRQAPSKEAVVDLFWPEADAETGRQSLSMALSSLRRQLEPPGVPRGAVLIVTRSVAGLNPDIVSADAVDFVAAVEAAGRVSSEPERLSWLDRAVELYRGPLLPGYYEEWVLSERERLTGLYLDALGRLAENAEACGDFRRALIYARRMVDADPLREEAQRELIRLYSAAGQVPEALRQYGELERLLREELDATPDARTQTLVEEIVRRSHEAHGIDAGTDVRLRPGSHARESPAAVQEEAFPPRSRPARPEAGDAPRAETRTLLLVDGSRLRESEWEPLAREAGAYGAKPTRASGGLQAFIFGNVRDAASCALVLRRRSAGQESQPGEAATPVRMALHTGDVGPEGLIAGANEYGGPAFRTAIRLLEAAHPGQLLCSEATHLLLRQDPPPGLQIADLGLYRLEALPRQPADGAADRLGARPDPDRLRHGRLVCAGPRGRADHPAE